MDRIVIIGAGGFGRELHDILCAARSAQFVGFIDDQPDRGLLEARGATWLGGMDQLPQHAGSQYVVGVGDPSVRQRLAARAESAGLRPGTAEHPSATFGLANHLSPGLVACAGARVTTNVRIGRHVHLNLNVTVGHDAVLGDFVTINPGANISGNVTLGHNVTVGTGAAIIQGVSVGAGTTVGAGAVVVRDLPPAVTAVGVPARAV